MGYQTVEDPSVFLRFPVIEARDPSLVGASLLGWTTTPWTLPSNTGAAVAEGASYVVVELDGERLVVGAALRERVLGEGGSVVSTIAGADLVGVRYEPPYPNVEGAHTVVAGDFVSLEDGTGIVHMAPAFGAEDLAVGRAQGWPIFKPVDDAGRFTEQAPAFVRGLFVKDADPLIVDDLRDRGVLLRCRDVRARVPVLLAMRHAAHLRRAHVVVRPHDRGEGASAPGERRRQLVPGPHQARPVRQLAREQRGLGALARTLLGHAAADLALRGGTPDRDRIARRAGRAGGARRERHRPASTDDRRGDVRLPGVRPDRHARPRGDRHLVRLRRHAVRAMVVSPGAGTRPGDVRGAVPRRLHHGGDRPDARLVLHADGRSGARLRRDRVPQRRLLGPSGRGGRQEDVQVPRQRDRSVRRARTARAPTRSAGG